jgi:hypothetical protein
VGEMGFAIQERLKYLCIFVSLGKGQKKLGVMTDIVVFPLRIPTFAIVLTI